MTITKYVWFYILMVVAMFNIFYVYFGQGLGAVTWTGAFFKSIALGVASILLMLLINLFVVLSMMVSRALHKKNFLRISLIILTIQVIVSFLFRISELINGVFCFSCWVNTALYLAMAILVIFMLRDLRALVRKLFLKA